MNWKRKQALLDIERRKPKPKKAVVVAVNVQDPEKEFVQLPLILDWHKYDTVPVLLIISPHDKYNDMCDCYDRAIRREYNYAWHSDNSNIGKELESEEFSGIRLTHCHAIAFDPDRHLTMSQLMGKLDYFHMLANTEFYQMLAIREERERNRSSMRHWNPWFTTAGIHSAATSYTVSYSTGDTWISLGNGR